ncbi:MAG: chemotaxis protein CheX [Proteobacteria bacterium]|nr:chemotaxis protein CheX [Pseudomonadota bacterium]
MSSALHPSLIDHFLAVVVRYLRSTVGVDAVVAAIGEPSSSPTIAVALDFGGDVRGPVTWVFPEPIALELVRRLMSDPNPDPDTAIDGATELANILTGRASEALEANGFHCQIGVPRVHTGDLPGGVAVRMTTIDGPIDVVLSMSTSTLKEIRVIV